MPGYHYRGELVYAEAAPRAELRALTGRQCLLRAGQCGGLMFGHARKCQRRSPDAARLPQGTILRISLKTGAANEQPHMNTPGLKALGALHQGVCPNEELILFVRRRMTWTGDPGQPHRNTYQGLASGLRGWTRWSR